MKSRPTARLTATCSNQHTQTINYVNITLEEVERLAGLLDGSSPLYVHPPGADSEIGKCGHCGAPIKCTVTEVKDGG